MPNPIQTDVPSIRAEFAERLPASLQPFLTWMTGCALPGQRPLLRVPRGGMVALSVIRLIGAVTLAVTAASVLTGHPV